VLVVLVPPRAPAHAVRRREHADRKHQRHQDRRAAQRLADVGAKPLAAPRVVGEAANAPAARAPLGDAQRLRDEPGRRVRERQQRRARGVVREAARAREALQRGQEEPARARGQHGDAREGDGDAEGVREADAAAERAVLHAQVRD
jgi:hypothetical protein